MKIFKCGLVCLSCLFILSACADPSVITMKDGTTIETTDEPDFNHKTGFYEFETADGQKVQLNKDEVLDIKEK